MKVQTLDTTPIETIHSAFIDAFSEYEVKIDVPLEKLEEMLLVRDYNPSLSLGCFEKDVLVGFVLSGYREIENKKYGYDTGTGVVKIYQNKHVGSILIEELLKIIEKKKIDYYVLEVLENNDPARKLYEKYGLKFKRKFRCYKKDLIVEGYKQFRYTKTINTSLLEKIDQEKYVSFNPSWQNSLRAYRNNQSKYYFGGYEDGGKLIGYGIIHRERGDILQVGVEESYRGIGLEENIIMGIAKAVNKESVTLLNIEDNSYMQVELEKNGYKNFVNQYEMWYSNARE